jgi:4-alpha-glucanotransferase
MVGTHDTPTFAGWLTGNDIGERATYALLPADSVATVRTERELAVARLAALLRGHANAPRALLGDLLEWLGRSDSPLVLTWLEDLWLEPEGVNLPGTSTAVRANWQRPMQRQLDDIVTDPAIGELLRRLDRARTSVGNRQVLTPAGG